jgi:hypothetical protein
MGLFNFSKKNKNEPEKIATTISSTGFYTISGGNLKPLNELPKKGSHVDISESIGFTTYHGVLTFESNVVEYIAFKRRTKDPIYVEAKDKTRLLTYSDVEQIIQKIDWGFEWRQLDFEDETT